MKPSRKLELFICIGFLICIFQWYSCNTSNNSDYKRQPNDTVQTWTTFISPPQWQSEGINYGAYTAELTRITKDTFLLSEIDAETSKKQWKRDTIYIVTITKPQLDSATGKPKLDSLKKPLPPIVKYGILPKQNILQDFNKSVQ